MEAAIYSESMYWFDFYKEDYKAENCKYEQDHIVIPEDFINWLSKKRPPLTWVAMDLPITLLKLGNISSFKSIDPRFPLELFRYNLCNNVNEIKDFNFNANKVSVDLLNNLIIDTINCVTKEKVDTKINLEQLCNIYGQISEKLSNDLLNIKKLLKQQSINLLIPKVKEKSKAKEYVRLMQEACLDTYENLMSEGIDIKQNNSIDITIKNQIAHIVFDDTFLSETLDIIVLSNIVKADSPKKSIVLLGDRHANILEANLSKLGFVETYRSKYKSEDIKDINDLSQEMIKQINAELSYLGNII